MVVDASVFRALHKPNITRFLESKSISIQNKIEEYRLDNSSKGVLLELINKLLEHNFLIEEDVNTFLIDELNYGRAKNLYMEFITENDKLNCEQWIERINLLEAKGYMINDKVTSKYYLNNIHKYIDTGEKKLIYSEIEDNDDGDIQCIRLLLGEGITFKNNDKCNNCYSVEINFKLMIIAIRIINWGDQTIPKYAPDNKFKEIFFDIKDIFPIKSHAQLSFNQNLVYKLVDDLTGRVLKSTIEYVNNIIKDDVNKNVILWGENILGKGNNISKSDIKVITELILNNYYRIKMSKEYRRLTPKILMEMFGVQAYPRQVKFFDDTVGEGKAKSPTPMESVLDTSVFYDIKARLDKERNIKNTIIYWLGCKDERDFGSAIHVDNHDRFKIVFYPKYYFNKEKCDYVLQEIKKYC
ncbi:hypothetical protein HYH96_07565 [Clostridium botulinum]|nr:hypothetical protein [Clostridium botulinum]AWB29591.1 hypothetical protein DBN47_04755 [Clostridium botulinum]KON10527.1 hypothetical protein ACP52_06950 [Clostridium botulinum]KOR54130.1 hypothetical protein ADT23_04260 [Clostridium botulinum]MBD5643755.1 hypothetical protein [Clostridium botulinum]MBY6831121.1 hypothetical protein [Clostridium botulinum]